MVSWLQGGCEGGARANYLVWSLYILLAWGGGFSPLSPSPVSASDIHHDNITQFAMKHYSAKPSVQVHWEVLHVQYYCKLV
jgi:hypothetical protein